jgi:hypothetical protein
MTNLDMITQLIDIDLASQTNTMNLEELNKEGVLKTEANIS